MRSMDDGLGAPGRRAPEGGLPGGLAVLFMMMQAGLQEHDWAISEIVERARSALGACSIVLSVLIAGIAGFAWILNSGDAASIMTHLRASHAIVPVALLGSAGFVALIWSAHFLVAALGMAGIRSPFSSGLIMTDGIVDKGLVHVWASTGEKAAYESACSAYAVALKNRESAIDHIAPKALLGQRLLLAGLGLTASATVTTLVSVSFAVGA